MRASASPLQRDRAATLADSPTTTAARLIVGSVAVAIAVHSAPYLATLARGRRAQLLPRLAGIGPRNSVALTFDDGPDPTSTPLFIEALGQLGWSATFFVLGENVRRSPEIVRDLVAAGHEVAVHGDRHRSHLWRAAPDVVADVRRARDTIADVSGTTPIWFRPPHGALSAPSLLAARRCDLRLVLWSTWGRDWTSHATPDSVTAHIRRDLSPGATLLLHDTDCTSAPGAWRSALGALPLIATLLAERGVTRVGTLTEHLGAT